MRNNKLITSGVEGLNSSKHLNKAMTKFLMIRTKQSWL